MQILQVRQQLVLTSRLDDMGHLPIKVLTTASGEVFVAMDPIGTKNGDWVFTIANSAARDAAGDKRYLTDLTVGGIIDDWQPDQM
ncbi:MULTISPECIES: carboxysome peptide B [Thiomicrorhabdus]|uniref:Carboxysome peptide B n=1 Tax=Thiomicrorhabdus xiamenensis TaxID=2739063 RepID=A0A7D4SZK2_9GAMM|nr:MULTISPECIES: carboxysome peptide B [Thiomicrorhabdus]MBO1923228.1 carboxysome peptide B [Thiomicrorhabdus sp. 6S3-12]QKI90004.1 carboxysome peptide B [Thiomicrorhabdus xiamenensis]